MTPALLFSKVAFSLTPAKLKEMWIIPLGSVDSSCISTFVVIDTQPAANDQIRNSHPCFRNGCLGAWNNL
jgi:hypothetical protein